MNDQSKLMNQAPPMMSLSQAQVMNQPLPQLMSQPQPQMMAPSSQAMAVQQQSQLMMMKSQSQPMMMNRNYKAWPQPQPQFAAQKPPQANLGRNNWKGKKGGDKRRMDKNVPNLPLSGQTSGRGGGGGGYIPPTLHELQSQNRMKARKFYPKKKFNNRFAPYAPRNTTSFIIRAKRRYHVMGEVNEEVVENGSENDSDGGSDAPHMGTKGESNPEMVEYVSRDGGSRSVGPLAEDEIVRDVDVGMEEYVPDEMILKVNEASDETRNEFVGNKEVEEFKSELTPEELIGNKNEVEDKKVKD